MKQIENYEIIEPGRGINLIGQKFGDYMVLYRTKPQSSSKEVHWLCQCQKCKKFFIKKSTTLRKGINKCSCENDLTGQRFGRWTVMNITNKRTKNRTIIWHCKCDCGNEKDVDAYTLKSGQSKSCGCLNKEKAAQRCKQMRLDLTGKRFGKLIALYPIYSGLKNEHTKWHCKCDCGNECDIDMGNLRSGKSQSCGCTQSKQEEKIIQLLTKNKIPFNYQHQFNDLLNKKFDFYINNQYLLEYDGSQHFQATETGWNTIQHLKRTRKNDLIKNKYCFEHNIPLIRIPYNKNYTFEDLKLETTHFLLTPENEKKYYDDRTRT